MPIPRSSIIARVLPASQAGKRRGGLRLDWAGGHHGLASGAGALFGGVQSLALQDTRFTGPARGDQAARLLDGEEELLDPGQRHEVVSAALRALGVAEAGTPLGRHDGAASKRPAPGLGTGAGDQDRG